MPRRQARSAFEEILEGARRFQRAGEHSSRFVAKLLGYVGDDVVVPIQSRLLAGVEQPSAPHLIVHLLLGHGPADSDLRMAQAHG